MESYICLSLTYFTHVIDSRSIHAAANGIILFFFWLHNIPLYACTTSSLSIPLSVQFNSVQSLSHLGLLVTPWTAVRQASLSITNSRSLLKLMSIESVMPSNYLILCCPLLLLPSIFLSIRVFSDESVLRIRWPKYWSFSFNISPSSEYSGLISFRMDWVGSSCCPFLCQWPFT